MQIQKGTPLRAEPDHVRAENRVASVANVSIETAVQIVNYEDPASLGLTDESLRKAEGIQGKTVDYVGVAWLDAGRVASRSVARIIFRDGRPQGTGFLVSDRLLLTNNHIIPNPALAQNLLAEFCYEIPFGEQTPSSMQFELDPDTFFETDEVNDLDYTLIAIGRPLSGAVSTAEYGCCPLSSSSAKHSVGELVNIVQHPNGGYKQVVFRENCIVHRGETVLHYLADTERGSSGAPVFNDQWQVVAIHHWGEPYREQSVDTQPFRTNVNEGIRISAIVRELEERIPRMNEKQQQLLREALNAPPPSEFGTRFVR